MKVLIVSHSSKLTGGSEKSLVEVIRYVVNTQKEIELCLFLPKEKGKFGALAEEYGIDVEVLPYHQLCFQPECVKAWKKPLYHVRILAAAIWDAMLALRLSARMKNRFDLVYSNTSTVFFGGFLSRMLHIPHVWHIREFSSEYGRSFFAGAEYLRKHLADRFLVPSQALAHSYQNHINHEKVNVIYNGVQVPSHERAKHTGINMLISGSIQRAKGQMFAVRVLNELKTRGGVAYGRFILLEALLILRKKTTFWSIFKHITWHKMCFCTDM